MMTNSHEMLMGLAIGIGLAAACGFRVFVPLLIMSIGVRADYLNVASNMEWVGSTPALLAFATATALEIAAYYVPWVDNALDSITTPTAIVAGTFASASMITGMDPMLQWSVAAIAGGGAAGAVQIATVATRATSTATTAGFGNPVVSTAEAGAATGVALLAIVVPVLVVVFLVLMFAFAARAMFRRRKHVPALQ
ncbi:DUF4126 domain-containing protein [Phycisphaerales bacterium AB-hyl4]|uniref:DUF4126 domain-containing protein n=1 Tax=Natronomicrosphaera hydrolytica TaxID=3242702 RepID=A0ABV4U990_9BACT